MAAAGIRIAVPDESGTYRQMTKIFGLSDGGFAVSVPYHSERRGFLFKFPVDYSQREMAVPFSELIPYAAEDRVKLSLHLDGFLQFSGENPGRIVSGRDEDGNPKGLGLVKNRLETPLSTGGPMFGVSAWGIDQFDPVKPNRVAVEFDESDIYYRDCAASEWNGYLIEGFVYPRRFITQANICNGRLILPCQFSNYEQTPRKSGLILPTRQPLFEEKGAIFNLTIIDFDSPHVIVALLVSRTKLDMSSPTGFTLSSPSDMKHAMMAMYPNVWGEPGLLQSLDYRPN